MPKKKDFLSNFFHDDGRVVRFAEKDKSSVANDQWDRRDLNQLQHEMKDFSLAGDQLAEFTPTGGPAMADAYYSLVKSFPILRDDHEIQPDHLINKFVSGEAQDLPEYENLRGYSIGDQVATGLACVTMEPKLEEIFDRLKQESEQLQQAAEMMQQLAGMEDESDSLEEMMAQAQAEGNSQELKDLQAQQALAQQAMDKLKQMIENAANAAQQGMEEKRLDVRAALKDAMQAGNDQARDIDTASFMWGLDPGAMQKMPAQKRIELSKRLNNEKFRRIAQLFGTIVRMAFAEQKRKTTIARNEVYEIELGNDLTRVLTSEMLGFTDDIMAMEAFRKYVEAGLLQFKLRGVERIAKGDVVYCFDGSGSMSGNREVWAKAVGLALLHVARKQKRGFTGIQFGSPGEYVKYEFSKDKVEVYHSLSKEHKTYDFMEGVTDFAELFLAGGTDFHTPLSLAMDRLTYQFDTFGEAKGDIVFATDGECAVTPEWFDTFKEEQKRVSFRVWGIAIDCDPYSEPLNSICDKRVFTIKNLIDGTDIKEILRGV